MKGLIEAIEKENLKDSVPAFNVGDTVKRAKDCRRSKAWLSPRRTAGSVKRSRFADCPTV